MFYGSSVICHARKWKNNYSCNLGENFIWHSIIYVVLDGQSDIAYNLLHNRLLCDHFLKKNFSHIKTAL